jgi:hypothetical protein
MVYKESNTSIHACELYESNWHQSFRISFLLPPASLSAITKQQWDFHCPYLLISSLLVYRENKSLSPLSPDHGSPREYYDMNPYWSSSIVRLQILFFNKNVGGVAPSPTRFLLFFQKYPTSLFFN